MSVGPAGTALATVYSEVSAGPTRFFVFRHGGGLPADRGLHSTTGEPRDLFSKVRCLA